MGNPLSKCCSNDDNVVYDDNNTTDPLLASNPVPSYNTPNVANRMNSQRSLFKRISTAFTIGGTPLSIEQGLKTFPFPLSEAEKEVLLKHEIPSTEIQRLSIGVDAGGMGIIHVAEWRGQKVAIKEASIHVISKEVEIYSRMKGCKSVVEFYGVTYPPDLNKLCIVTKFANKGSLTWHLKVDYHSLSWDDKLRLATQISTGIARLHQEGIYHRDLHGGNILIDDQGNAMLTDFGASTIMEERVVRNIHQYAIEEVPTVEGHSKFISQRITGLGDKGKKSTRSRTVTDDPLIGVMAYIAPERFRNPSYFDSNCDIYSLGVLLWELTTGHPAFAKVPQDVNLAVAIMNGKRETAVDGTPVEYKALYERCWHSDPDKRPSLDEILDSLAKVRTIMTPEQLATTRFRKQASYSKVDVYEQTVSIPRPTSNIQQYLVSRSR
ncbi:MAG: kinase-like domain-containing protein [Linnemannia gamsii]|nr:MAG: kinase-like domain-containing protein [Linnemannia gamsii]